MIANRSNNRRRPGARRHAGARRGRGRGLGLVELLLALSISASVLVAVAYAVDVSFRAYSVNQEQNTLMQRARITMHRLLTQIRVTAEHQPVNAGPLADFKAGKVAIDNGIRLLDEDGRETSYKYDPFSKEIGCVDADGNEFVAVRGVEAFEVKFEPMKSETSLRAGGAYDLLMRATIKLTVRNADQSSDVDEKAAPQTVSLTASVVPRCNVW